MRNNAPNKAESKAAAGPQGCIYLFSNTVKIMPNTSQIPATGLPAFRSDPSGKKNRLQAVPPAKKTSPADESTTLPITGPRKLVRPKLPAQFARNRAFSMHQEPAILAHQTMTSMAANHESSHAEAFYFQKQVQSQTRMVIVLEDGEQIEGCIEWYDRNAIKVKGATRMLVYKARIKYIYKAGEKHA